MSLELTQEIKDNIREIALRTPNIVSVGYGYKISNGVNTGEGSIVYGVKVKKPLSELSSEEILPSSLYIGGSSIKTDIVERGEILPLVTSCNSGCGQNAGLASVANRSYTRPVKGGLSMTTGNNSNSVGTFGLVVKDVATGAIVGLTNNHVSIPDAFYTSQRDLNGVISNEHDPIDYAYQGTEGGAYFVPENIMGRSLRYVPIYKQSSGLVNSADAAIFSLDSNTIDPTQSWRQVGLDSVVQDHLPFATTLEIDNLLNTNPQLYSSGRTTGPKGGASCPLKVFELGSAFPISYKLQNSFTTIIMENVISYFKPPLEHPEASHPNTFGYCCNPVRGGDSGSALIADINGTIKVIGLVFAGGGPNCDGGPNSYAFGYACRIDEVASQLGITNWDKADVIKVVNTNTIEYVTQLGGSSDKNKICNGKTHWQVGLTNTLNNPC